MAPYSLNPSTTSYLSICVTKSEEVIPEVLSAPSIVINVGTFSRTGFIQMSCNGGRNMQTSPSSKLSAFLIFSPPDSLSGHDNLLSSLTCSIRFDSWDPREMYSKNQCRALSSWSQRSPNLRKSFRYANL